jgi:hypothetical protein
MEECMQPRAKRKGVVRYVCPILGFKHYYIVLLLILADFCGFCPILGDLELDLRPDLGRKLGG